MQKLSAANFDSELEEFFSQGEKISEGFVNIDKHNKSLASSVGTFKTNPFGVLILDCDLPDRKAIELAVKLAKAIDKNSVSDIRYLKSKYGSTKEFCSAKEYLDQKAKDVWEVFQNKNTKMHVPREAMKVLGITNIPSLEFMLGDRLKYFEDDGSSTTADIIRSILTNKNLNYTFEDIYQYLVFAHKKHSCIYNLKTVEYLIPWIDCDVKKLTALGVDRETLFKALQSFSFITKLKYLFKGGLKLSVFPL